MAMRFRLVAAVLGLLSASMWSIPRAAADPTWDFIETTCASMAFNGCVDFNSSGNTPLTLPLTLGSITGSGAYMDSTPIIPGTFSESGDFSLTMLSAPTPTISFGSSASPYCLVPYESCDVNINLTTSSSGVTGNLLFSSIAGMTFVDLTFSGTTFSGTWGSDDILEGCGFFANCQITGVLEPVPEPSSLPMLLAGVGMIGGALYFGRKKARPA